MATSGTTGLTKYPVKSIVEDAFRRCGLDAAGVTAETAKVARDQLWLALTSMASAGAMLWRIKEHLFDLVPGQKAYTMPVGVADVKQVLVRFGASTLPDVTEIRMSQLNLDDYSSLPNKEQRGLPIQYWYDRQVNPRIVVWPVPDDSPRSVRVYLQYHVEDIGSLTDDIDLPLRWYDAAVARLASRLSMILPGIDTNRIMFLKQLAEEAYELAAGDEGDKGPVYLTPSIGAYTR